VPKKKRAVAKRKPSRRKRLSLQPEILIFDVDGVLVDVRETFWRSAMQTVQHLTGKRATWADLYKWKSKSGNNDDWSMISNWATALGRPVTYLEARAAFEKFYWDFEGRPGNVRKEKILVTPAQIERWARRYELNLFTGRTRQEYSYTFADWPAARHFRSVVTMDDVERRKPFPDGLLKILAGRDPQSALYLGDNIDDALAARSARVPFMAILPRHAHGYRRLAARFRELGALALLHKATDLNSRLDEW